MKSVCNSPFHPCAMMKAVFEKGELFSLADRRLWDVKHTGTSRYDMCLNEPEKFKKELGGVGSVEQMSPDKYLEELAGIQGLSKQEVIRRAKPKTVKKISERIREGKPTNLVFLDYNDETHDGRSRTVAARNVGLKTMPVLVVRKAR